MPSPSWSARNQRAQALGYRNYYDYRAHDYGRIPADQATTPDVVRRVRGHSGLRELLQVLADPRRHQVIAVAPVGEERRPNGQWGRVRVDVTTRGLRGATTRAYYLRGRAASSESLRMVRQAIDHPGALQAAPPGGDGGAYREIRDRARGAEPDLADDEEPGDEGDWYLDDDYQWDWDAEDYDYDYLFIAATSIGELAS